MKGFPRVVCLLALFILSFPTLAGQPSPCGPALSQTKVLSVGQACGQGQWYVETVAGEFSGTLYASDSLAITAISADGDAGEIVAASDGLSIRFHINNRQNTMLGFRFNAPPDTRVVLVPDGQPFIAVGGRQKAAYTVVNLTDPAIRHLFLVTPKAGQVYNKGETETVRWVSSSHYDRVFLAVGRSPYDTTWIRSPDGQQAFYIANTGSFTWDVLRINSACHDFYLKLSGYGNDGSGYHLETGGVFTILHDLAPGFVCPELTK